MLDAFDSGVASLDDLLRRRALPNQVSGASRTFVVVDAGQVVAYHALAASAAAPNAAPGLFKRNMPDPIPLVVLGRLAIAVGIRGLLVHAISEEAKAFYVRLGLAPSPLEPMTPMTTVADLKTALG